MGQDRLVPRGAETTLHESRSGMGSVGPHPLGSYRDGAAPGAVDPAPVHTYRAPMRPAPEVPPVVSGDTAATASWGPMDPVCLAPFAGRMTRYFVGDKELTHAEWVSTCKPDSDSVPVSSGAFPDYDRYMKRLADAQRYKLRLNAHKGDLGDHPPEKLMKMVKAELAEVEEAMSRGSEIEVLLEVADTMNFLLGLAISTIRRMNETE